MKILTILAVSVLLAVAAGAQPATPRVTHLPADLLADVGALPTAGNGLWLLGGGALALGVHQFEDPEGISEVLDQGLIDGFVDFGNIWADMVVQAPLALGTWGVGAWTDHPEVAATGYDLTRGLALTYATVFPIKLAVDRTRPNGEDYSFPSGHTATAFMTAGVLTRRHGGWLGGTSLVLATLTGLGRMEDLKHYPSDVVAGAALGWVIWRTWARDDGGARRRDDGAWRLAPAGTGLVVARRF